MILHSGKVGHRRLHGPDRVTPEPALFYLELQESVWVASSQFDVSAQHCARATRLSGLTAERKPRPRRGFRAAQPEGAPESRLSPGQFGHKRSGSDRCCPHEFPKTLLFMPMSPPRHSTIAHHGSLFDTACHRPAGATYVADARIALAMPPPASRMQPPMKPAEAAMAIG
jgi:hypothetical protein